MPIGRQALHLLWQMITTTGLFDRMEQVLHAHNCSGEASLLFHEEETGWGEDPQDNAHRRLIEVFESVEKDPTSHKEWDDSLRCIAEAVLCEVLDAGRGRAFPELYSSYSELTRDCTERLIRCLEQDGYQFADGHLQLVGMVAKEQDIDSLTNLLSRKALMVKLEERLTYCKEAGHPISLAFLDLDNFKAVNDTLGHQAGDRVLTAFGSLLNRIVAGRGIVVGRYGGDEFLIVAPNHTSEELQALASRVQKSISQDPELTVPTEPKLGCSVGIASVSATDIPSSGELIERADRAVYAAKSTGKGRTVAFSEEIRSKPDLVEVTFTFQGTVPIQARANLEVKQWRHHPAYDNLHFEAQVIGLAGGLFESDNVHVTSSLGSWTGDVPGTVVSFRQTGKVLEFRLAIPRKVYDEELVPSCKDM